MGESDDTKPIHVPSFRFFRVDEFDCHDGTEYPEKWVATRLTRLVRVLDAVREKWAAPIVVVSGYRSPSWNLKVGGAKSSQHMEGIAADIKPRPSPDEPFVPRVERLHRLILEMHEAGNLPDLGGLGYYPGRWVHVDVRQMVANRLARWFGGGIGSERVG